MKRARVIGALLCIMGFLSGCQSKTLDIELKSDVFEIGTLKSACESVASVNGNTVTDIDILNNTLVAKEKQISCSASDLNTLGESLLVFESEASRSEHIITLVDTIAPTIHLDQLEIGVDVNNKYFNLKDLVKVTDNYDENLVLAINGSFDIHKVGDYLVTLLAKDSSGNETHKEVLIRVNELEKEIVTIIEERPVYIEGPSSSGSSGNVASSNGSSEGTSSSNSRGDRPSDKHYLFSDGYTMDSAPSACSQALDDAYAKGWGGGCSAYYGKNNESEYPLGMSLVIYD